MGIPAPHVQPSDIARLRRHWRLVLDRCGAVADVGAVAAQGDSLIDRWREPHRRYHDLAHLSAVLRALDTVTATPEIPGEVLLAAWFHDAVHDGVPGQDERASADLAVSVLTGLGVPRATATEVARLVLVTVDHRVSGADESAASLVDADLAVLAGPAPEYARYVAAVRAEYAHVTDADFAVGRRAVLGSLMDRPRLFHTEIGYRLWEAPARRNLAAELSRLPANPSA